MKLALFDFDGTITTKDSMVDFITYAGGYKKFLLGFFLLSPILILYKLKLIPNWKAKEIVLSYFFKGWEIKYFENKAERYSRDELPKIVRKTALEKIDWHKAQGHKVAVVTASIEDWLKGWCEVYSLDLIATKLEVKNGRLTGRFSTKNCYGIEKVKRIKEKYNLEGFDQIFVYGDSSDDREMLALADSKEPV